MKYFKNFANKLMVLLAACSVHCAQDNKAKNDKPKSNKIADVKNNQDNKDKKPSKFGLVINFEGALGRPIGHGQPVCMYTFLLDAHRLEHRYDAFKNAHGTKSPAMMQTEHGVSTVEEAFHQSHNISAFLQDKDGTYKFLDLTSDNLEKKFTSDISGIYKIALISGCLEFIKSQKASLGLELGAGFSFGKITETSKYAKVEREIGKPMLFVGPVFKYYFSEKMNAEFSVFSAMYATKITVVGTRGEFTKEYLGKVPQGTIHGNVLKQLNIPDAMGSYEQKAIAKELDEIFDNLDEKQRNKNTFHTKFTPSFGIGAALCYQIFKKTELRLSLRYIFPHTAKTKDGEKITDAHLLVASSRSTGGHEIPKNVTITRNGMFIGSIGILLRLV